MRSDMTRIGHINDFPALRAIFRAIFERREAGLEFCASENPTEKMRLKYFPKSGCFAVDHLGIRYVEQNPTTGSTFAKRARQGARIIWIIQGSEYIGGIDNGEVWMSNHRLHQQKAAPAQHAITM